MKVLLVSATTFEVQPTIVDAGYVGTFFSRLGAPGEEYSLSSFDCLVTGVGQLQCAAWLSKVLSQRKYDIVIQAGIAGSFTDRYPRRSVVLVEEEIVSDLGAETRDGFLDVFEMGLMSRDQLPFSQGVLRAPALSCLEGLELPRARAITVNRVLSDPRSIAWVEGRYAPDVVSMEGAAFFYTCLMHHIPCVQLRAVSDRVGPRDTSTWDIPGAISALHTELGALLRMLTTCKNCLEDLS
jgi:futalosine hydrolase